MLKIPTASPPTPMPPDAQNRAPLGSIVKVFLKLSLTSFGGPAVHVAMMRQEIVGRRGWLTDPEFLDLLGAANLLPGPTSTELGAYIGYRTGGWPGFLLASALFIGPPALIVLALAWAYVYFGTSPQLGSLFYGVRPVLIAVILQALWGLAKAALRGPLVLLVGIASLIFVLLGANAVVVLVGGGLAVLSITFLRNVRRTGGRAPLLPLLMGSRLTVGALRAPGPILAGSVSLASLFGVMVKTGAVLFGSGYVLLAFLHGDLVDRLHWITDRQLLDAITIGQFTPGPVLTTATFVGYLVGGFPGATVATVGIFLPGLLFVAGTHPVISRLRRSPWTGPFLDGVNVAALALMSAVTWHLGVQAIVDPLTAAVAIVSLGLLFSGRVNSVWLLAGAMVLGLLVR